MSDNYPSNFPVEIDRPRLQAYLRTSFFLLWTLPFAMFGVLAGFGGIEDAVKNVHSSTAVATLAFECIAIGIGSGFLFGLVLYLLLSHRRARRMAASLEVSVEGPFLRIRQETFAFSDRKLHFRSIVDYTTVQGPLMRRFGIHALRMTTTSGGPHSILTVFGVKDCLRLRDILCEVDRLRENT